MRLPPASRRHPGYVAGRWYGPTFHSTLATQAVAADVLYMMPIDIMLSVGVDRLGMTVGTQAVGLAKMGIYRNDPATGRPGALIAECAAALDFNVTATLGVETALPETLRLAPGVYWLASVFSASTAVPITTQSNINQGAGIASFVGSLGPGGVARGGSSPAARLTVAQTYASAFPASGSGVAAGVGTPGTPIMAWRAA